MARELGSRTYLWMGTGAVGLGIAAALASGSGVAHADSPASGSSAAAKPAHHQKHASALSSASHTSASPTGKVAAAQHRAPSSSGLGFVPAAAVVHVAKDIDPIAAQGKEIAEERNVIGQEGKVVAQEITAIVTNFPFRTPADDFAGLFSGGGSASLTAAAAAWNGLATGLNWSAQTLQSVTSGLATQPWAASASPMVTAAGQPYVGWLTKSAAQAESAATQASAAAAAYEAAFNATTPPAVVAANRSLLATLIATNFLGINTPMIVATNEELWAQDVAAMFSYYG